MTENQHMAWATQFDCVAKIWLPKFPNIKVRKDRARDLRRFCAWADTTPPELLALKDDPSSVEAEMLVDRFYAENDEYTESVKIGIVNAAKSFFRRNYRQLQSETVSPTYEKEDYHDLDKEKLWNLYQAGKNRRDRALLMFIFCTACARETVSKARWRHFERDWQTKDCPCLVFPSSIIKGHGKGKYKGVKQVTFLTPEAKKELLKYKEWYQEKVLGRPFKPEDPIFWGIKSWNNQYNPISYQHIWQICERLSKDAAVPFTPHDGRRWVENALEDVGVPQNRARKIRGRKIKGEEAPYSQPAIEQLRNDYRKAAPLLEFIPKSREQQYANAIAQARALLATVPPEAQPESFKTFLQNLPANVRKEVKKKVRLENVTAYNGADYIY